MKTTPTSLDAFRSQLTDTIQHGTKLLADLTALSAAFPTLLPSLEDLPKSARATQVAVLCGFNPDLPTDLHQLVESLADVLAGLTAADGGEAWLRRQIDTLQTPGESSAA
jgi:hypothetical protein